MTIVYRLINTNTDILKSHKTQSKKFTLHDNYLGTGSYLKDVAMLLFMIILPPKRMTISA